jgi:hypothetical protein
MFLRKGPRRRSKASRGRGGFFWVAFALFVFAFSPAIATEKLSDLQDHFDKESHPDGKVRSLERLALAQFEAATEAGKTNDYSTVGLTFEKYRDNVKAAFDLLRKQQPDADKHPKNYRQLELEVRRGIRETEETLLITPGEMKPPLEIVRGDLLQLDDTLINLLFPRRSKDPVKVPPAPEGQKP